MQAYERVSTSFVYVWSLSDCPEYLRRKKNLAAFKANTKLHSIAQQLETLITNMNLQSIASRLPAEWVPKRHGKDQQDAHEAWVTLKGAVHKSTNKAKGEVELFQYPANEDIVASADRNRESTLKSQ